MGIGATPSAPPPPPPPPNPATAANGSVQNSAAQAKNAAAAAAGGMGFSKTIGTSSQGAPTPDTAVGVLKNTFGS